MPQILLNIPDSEKAEEFLAHFVPNLVFIENAEILESEPKIDNKVEEPTLKIEYSIEDLQAIIDDFPADKKWTYTDLEKYFPQDLKIKVEIINNQIFIMPTPNINHQKISNTLSSRMTFFVEENNLGEILVAPMDVKFDENNVVQPDILFIAVTKVEDMGEIHVEIIPDLTVEIWSPGNNKAERQRKYNLYESKGVTEYWQIEPKEKSVWIETLNEQGKYELFSEAKEVGIVKSKILKGFEIDLKKLFKE